MKKSDIFLLFFIRAKRSKAGVGQETGARVSYSTLQRYPSQVQAQCLPSSSTKSIHPMLHKPTLFFFFLTNWSKHGNTSKWLPVHPIIKKKLILNWASLVACFKMQSITPKLCEHDHQKRRTCSTSRAFAATGVAFLQGHFNVIETASTESCAIAFLLHLLTNCCFHLNWHMAEPPSNFSYFTTRADMMNFSIFSLSMCRPPTPGLFPCHLSNFFFSPPFS